MAEAGLLADAAAWKRLLRVAASTPSLAKPDDSSVSSAPGGGSGGGGAGPADAFAGAYFDVGAGACYDGRADAAGVRTALVDALPACCGGAACPRRQAATPVLSGDALLGVALACAVDGDGGGAVAALLAHSSTLGAGAVAAAFGSSAGVGQAALGATVSVPRGGRREGLDMVGRVACAAARRAVDAGAWTPAVDAGLEAVAAARPTARTSAPALLAGLVSTALAPLLAADAGGVAELLVKLAKGNVDLFRGAVAALPPADVALVQAAMGKAIKRAAAPPTRLAPPPRASPGGGGLKLNMGQYR
ncbi:acetylcholine-gated cation-selective channel [Aureococcus anophagefferens]|nr:acetylcholine-gated cation-selective channel [Aureococcus anophagefferens]